MKKPRFAHEIHFLFCIIAFFSCHDGTTINSDNKNNLKKDSLQFIPLGYDTLQAALGVFALNEGNYWDKHNIFATTINNSGLINVDNNYFVLNCISKNSYGNFIREVYQNDSVAVLLVFKNQALEKYAHGITVRGSILVSINERVIRDSIYGFINSNYFKLSDSR